MIEIIEKGTRQKQKCPECGCLFTYEKEDINYSIVHNYDYVICPQYNINIKIKGV